MVITSISTELAKMITSYAFGKFVDTALFKNEAEFREILKKVIQKSMEEFGTKHPIPEIDDKIPFYQSSQLMEALLKYRLFEKSDEISDETLLKILAENPQIITPPESQIKEFFNFFEDNLRKDNKLKKQFCKENAPEEVFNISKKVNRIIEILENKQEPVTLQLKILSITASPQGSEIFYEKEQQTIIEAFHEIPHEQLFIDLPDFVKSTKEEIHKYLVDGRHDVLQITAHGGLDEKGEGFLVFENFDNNICSEEKITATELTNFLLEQKSNHDIDLKLIILSSCHSAQKEDAFISVADTLHKAGFANVIGMKKTISHDASIVFNRALFKALLAERTIEQAFNIGKQEIQKHEEELRKSNPHLSSEVDIPVLFSGNPSLTIQDFSPHQITVKSRVKQTYFKSHTIYRGYVGRRNQIREVFTRIENNAPAIVLKGPGGVGKSTLTARILVDLIREKYEYIEFQKNVNAADILEQIAKQTGREEIATMLENFSTIQEKWIFLYNQYLSHKKFVIIFDNFEDNQDLENNNDMNKELKSFLMLIARTFSANKSLMLFSTRYNMPDFEEYTINIPEYSPLEIQKKIYFEEALQKLDEKALKLFNETIGKNPRSLDLMNALLRKKLSRNKKIKNFDMNALEALFPTLKQHLEDGELAGTAFSPFILDDLVKLLTPSQQQTLKILSIFRKPVSQEGLDFFHYQYNDDDLFTLEDLSLLERMEADDRDFYYTHRLTAQYYREELPKQEGISLNQQAAKYWRTVYEEDRTIENHLEEREYLLAAEAWDEAAGIAFAAEGLLSRWGSVFTALTLNIDTYNTRVSLINQAIALGNIGNIYSALGEPQKALKYLQEALEILRQLNHKQGEASVLGNIGLIYSDLGEPQKALKYLQEALEIDKELNYKLGEAIQLGNIGLIYSDLGELQKAIEYMIPAIYIFMKLQSPNIRIVINNLLKVIDQLGWEDFERIIHHLGYDYDEIKQILDHEQQNDG